MEEQFWIIWSPTSDKPPKKKFVSEAQAMKVIEEMAKGNAGHDFYAMEVIGHARLEKPIVSRIVKKVSQELQDRLEDVLGRYKTVGRSLDDPDTTSTIETTAQQPVPTPQEPRYPSGIAKDRPGKVADLLGTGKLPGTFGFPFGSSIDSDARKSVTVFVNTLADWARDGAPMCDRCGSRAADLQGNPSCIMATCRSCGKKKQIHPISKDKK